MTTARLWTKDFTLGTLVNFLLMVNYYSLMVVVTDYSLKSYHASAATAGLAASIFIIGALAARVISGRLMDKIGRKNMLLIGSVGEVAFSALYLLGLGFGPLFAIRLLHGFSYGMCSTTIGTMVTGLVPASRKGEGIGYYMLSVTLGAAIGPLLGIFLTQNAGFNVLFIMTAAVAVLGLAAAACLTPPARNLSARDALGQLIRKKDKAQAHAPEKQRFDLGSYIELNVLPLSIVCAVLYFCYSSLLAFLTPFASENGLDDPAGYFFVVYALATFATRPLTGKLFDRRGDRSVMVPAYLAFIVGMALLAAARQAPAMLIAAALLGFGVGTVQASGLALAVRMVPDERLSLANSTFYSLLDIGVGIGPLLLGIVQPFWGYRGLFQAMSLVAIVGLAGYLLVSRKHGVMRRILERYRDQ